MYNPLKNKKMKFIKVPTPESLKNFIVTVFTAFISTFFLSSCNIL